MRDKPGIATFGGCKVKVIDPDPGGRRVQEIMDATDEEWNDWRWQLRHRFTELEQFSKVLELTPEEEEGIRRSDGRMALSVTPYLMGLMEPSNPRDPIRMQAIPTAQEFDIEEEDRLDPLSEDQDSPVPGLVHRYPDRVLLLVTHQCPIYCRYCTRKRWVGEPHPGIGEETLELACDYIARHKKIRDVLISGGDPLMLSDEKLARIVQRVRQIPTVEFVRMGSKVPAILPMRITPSLVEALRPYHPLYLSLHFTHPKELTPETRRACNLLADGGFPLGSQTVLLKGVNDRAETLKLLFQQLLTVRVRPYYLYQCDPVVGAAHFRTTVEKGIEIIEKLRGHTSGYAVPTYVVDAPGGGGKIPLQPNYYLGRVNGTSVLRNFEGKVFECADPAPRKRAAASSNGNGNGNGHKSKSLLTKEDLLTVGKVGS